MNIQNYNFEGGLESGFKSLFSASDMELRIADDIDDGGLPDECVRFELDTGGPISNEHQNADGEYDNYAGTFEIEIRTPRAENEPSSFAPPEYDYLVESAGAELGNGEYNYNGDVDGKPSYINQYGATIYWRPSYDAWQMKVTSTEYYRAFASTPTPPLSGWEPLPGAASPAPELSQPTPMRLFKNRHIELVAKTRRLLEEIGVTEISTHWPDAHAPTKIKPTGTSRETDAEFRITTLSYEMQFRIT